MPNFNEIKIIGHCGGDPEMRYTPNGIPVTSFNVAVNDPRKVNDEWQDNTEWFRVTCFKDLAERINEKLHKGAIVFVTGKLRANRWEDKNGEKRTTLEIAANKVLTFEKSEAKTNVSEIDEDEF